MNVKEFEKEFLKCFKKLKINKNKNIYVTSNLSNISKIRNFWQNPIKYNVNTFWFIPTIVSLLLKIDRSQNGIEYSKQIKITNKGNKIVTQCGLDLKPI